MIDISVSIEFNPNKIEKEIIKKMSNNIKKQLRNAGISGIKVSITKSHGNLQVNIDGPDEQLKKAKQFLDL